MLRLILDINISVFFVRMAKSKPTTGLTVNALFHKLASYMAGTGLRDLITLWATRGYARAIFFFKANCEN